MQNLANRISKEHAMKKVSLLFALLLCVTALYAVDDVVRGLHGTITAIDTAAKKVTIKMADGTERTLRFAEDTVVEAADASGRLVKGAWHDLKEGTEVAVHYTKRGTEDVALEFDKIGRDGMKVARGTLKDMDKGTKRMVIDTGRGAEDVFWMTDHAAKRTATDIGKGVKKGTEMTMYYTEDAGKKVVHFFEVK
jgi:hypothetical protein